MENSSIISTQYSKSSREIINRSSSLLSLEDRSLFLSNFIKNIEAENDQKQDEILFLDDLTQCVKIVSANNCDEMDIILKVCRSLIDSELFLKRKLEEILNCLIENFDRTMDQKSSESPIERFFDVYKTLILFTEKLSYCKNPEKIEVGIDKVIAKTCEVIIKGNNNEYFLFLLNELFDFIVVKGSSNLISILLNRKSLKSILLTLYEYLSRAKEEEKTQNFVKIFFFFLEKYKGDFENLIIKNFSSLFLKNRGFFQHFQTAFDILYTRAEETTIEKSQQVRKELLQILLNKSVSPDEALPLFRRIKSLNWDKAYINNGEFVSKMKALIMRSNQLHNKIYLLEIIFPWIAEGISMTELKLILKACSTYPSLTVYFFRSMLELTKHHYSRKCHFRTSKNSQIFLEFEFNISLNKEFSLWTKVLLESLPQTIMIIQINSNITLSIIIEKLSFKIEMIKGSERPFVLLSHRTTFNEKDWNLIGLSFNLRKKDNGKYKLVLHINEKSEEIFIVEIGMFKFINSIQFEGDCKMDFFNIYTSVNINSSFFPIPKNNEDLLYAKKHVFLQFSARTERPECVVPIRFIIKAERVFYTSLFELIKTIGSINIVLPIIMNSTESATFELFFKILTEMSKAAEFSSILDELTFPVLRHILTEKSRLLAVEWLDAIEGFLLSFRSFPQYQKAVNNLYLNYSLWSCLNQDFYIYYMEGVKTHLTSNEYLAVDEDLLDIYNFFLALCGTAKNKKLVSSYMLQILSQLFKKVQKAKKAKIFNEFFEDLVECCLNCEVFEDLAKFLKELALQEWVIDDEEYLSSLNEIFVSVKDRCSIQVTANLIELWLHWCMIYYRKGKFFTLGFVEIFIKKFKRDFGHRLSPKICETVLDYVSRDKFAKSKLVVLSNAVLENLGNNANEFNENLKILTYYCETRVLFRNELCKLDSFPGWLMGLLRCEFFINEELKKLIILCTGNTELENLDKLRLILYELLKKNRVSFVFSILKEVLFMLFPNHGIDLKKKKYLFEYLNVLEDVILRVPYHLMDRDFFLPFIKSCIIPIKDFSFSTGFSNISGLSGLTLFDKAKNENFSNGITLREGGMARQLLLILFYGLSYGPNQEIEDFLLKFRNENSNTTESRAEWADLEFSQSVKTSNIFLKPKQKSCKNLIFIYIYIEWLDIIRVYKRRQHSQESIEQSISNFVRFIVESKAIKKIENEVKSCIDVQGYKEFNRILLSHFNHLTSVYLPEFQTQYEEVQRHLYKTAVFEERTKLEETDKHEKFKQEIREYLRALSDHLKNSAFSSFVDSKNIEIECLFKILTSLKVYNLSNFYRNEPYFEPQNLKNRESSSVCLAQVKEPKKQKPFNQTTDFFFQQYLKKVLKEHKLFCGKFAENQKGRFYLKSSFDQLGRRLLTKSKETQEPFKQRNMPGEAPLVDSLEISKSFDYENIEESNPSEDSNTRVNVEDPEEVFLSSSEGCFAEFECEIIYIKGFLYGTLNVHEECLVFSSKATERPEMSPVVSVDGDKVLCSFALPECQIKKKVVKIWMGTQITEVIYKKFVHNTCSIEIYLKCGKSYLINFYTRTKLKEVYSALKRKFKNKNISFLNKTHSHSFTEDWKNGRISNFDYLMILNKLSSRSFNNLSQYPVFPWIIKDFESEKIDLTDSSVYRDLMYPVCAQTEQTRQKLKQSFAVAKVDSDLAYNFGTHYSAGGLILHYLLRIQPFTQESQNLHKGTFDLPDRIFQSVKKSWKSSQSNLSDTKELVPEFFYLPELFLNTNHETLGVRQNGKKVNNVRLPKWSKRNVYSFLIKHRKALESEYVSKNLHFWINLIFGYRQKGKKAEEFCNLFHPITYQDVYTQSIMGASDILRQGYYCQAVHYGQIPESLFFKPHLKKITVSAKKPLPERLLTNISYECIKRLVHNSLFIPLSTASFFMVLLCEENKIICFSYKWGLGSSFDLSTQKRVELKGVFATKKLMAVMFEENIIATAGYYDFSLALHDLSGALRNVFYFHSLETSDLFGGSLVVSSSLDSTVVIWDGETKTNLHGHISSVVSVAAMHEYRLVASCSEFILIHDSRSGEAIHKIKQCASKVCASPFGLFLFQVEEEIKVYYLNGQFVCTSETIKGKQFMCINEILVKEDRGMLRMTGIVDSSLEKQFHMQDALDLVSFYYSGQRDALMFVNRVNNVYVLCSLECGKENIEYW